MNKLIITLLFFVATVHAQNVNVPDIYLKGRLNNARPTNTVAQDINGNYVRVDANGDHEIQTSEAESIYFLNVSDARFIEDLTGIEAFVNLKGLNVSSNLITSLDLSPFPNLIGVICNDNQLTSLDLSVVPLLQSAACYKNNIVNFNLGVLPQMTYLNLSDNDIPGALDVSNSPNMLYLNVDGNPITSLNVNGLASLESLNARGTQLTTLDLSTQAGLKYAYFNYSLLTGLDLSHSPNLLILECTGNDIATLNVNGLTNLTELRCTENEIQTLDASSLSSLIVLQCTNNALTSLNVAGLANLEILECGQNPNIGSLDLTGLTGLKTLNVGFNDLVDIDVSGCPNLEYFRCFYNKFATLNVSGLTHLQGFSFSHNLLLTHLFMKNGKNDWISFIENPSLQYICADASEIANVQSDLDFAALTNVSVSSYCSFTPGGNYNTIRGNIKYDVNGNGCDASDLNFPNIRVNVDDGTTFGAVMTNNTGDYAYYLEVGNFNVTVSPENPTWFDVSPTTVTIPFADDNNTIVQQDFCIAPVGIHPDVEVVIAPVLAARPGFDATYKIVYRNKGNRTFSEGMIGLEYQDAVLDFVSASQPLASQTTGNLSWQYTNLLPFESRVILLTLNVNSPMETPPVNIDQLLNFRATVTPTDIDEHTADNTFEYKQRVVGSYDPNDIACLEGDSVAPTEIGKYLHYAINFENMGTFHAENIVVRTEVDTTRFNMKSLQLMDTSHPVHARIEGNVAEFVFQGINLDIGGHGHILLKIKTLESLNVGDAVAKRADIFFDYNYPIDTGLANTVFETLSNSEFDVDESIVISPNPAHSEVAVKADSNIKSMQVYDAQGRIITASLIQSVESTLNVSGYANGVYFIKITTEKGIKVQKLIKK